MSAAARYATPPVRGVIRRREPMGRHTSWNVGGTARLFFRPADVDDLAAFLGALPEEEPVLWLGLGSNLLVRDGGFPGTVICCHRALTHVAALEDDRVYGGAGVPCAKLARFAADRGLTGAEFLAGIPGTLGGALAMNAGAFGGETWELVAAVDTMDRRGHRRRRESAAFQVGYRSVTGPADEWFLGAELALTPGDAAASRKRIRALLAERARNQPTGQPSCGSVFRNPPGDHAARLIEAAGFKGTTRGGAWVSEKHANFIVHAGEATASDVEALIGEVRAEVARRFGVALEPEVRIVGEPLPAPREAGS